MKPIELMSKISPLLNSDSVSAILESLGYEINRTSKFALRSENTASASIRPRDGYIVDFGGEFKGDIIDLLRQYHGYSFAEAVAYVADCSGIKHDINTQYTNVKPVRIKQTSKTKAFEDNTHALSRIRSEIARYDSSYFYDNPIYRQELLKTVPMWIWKEAGSYDIDSFKRNTTFDGSTLIVKIFDYEDKLISYKRRRTSKGKWITAWNTHPNKQCLLYNKKNGPILVVEGHHDFLTAMLMGFNVIAIPNVGYNKFNDSELEFVRYQELIFIPDIGDKGKSIATMIDLMSQIDSKHVMIDISKFVPTLKEKMDLSDATELWTHGLDAFKEKMFGYLR